jgi:hypothetical protein
MTINRKREHDDFEDLDPEVEKPDSHPIRSFVAFLFFLAAALLIFVMLAVRTGGFREIVSVKNEEWFQTRLAIRESRIAFPYDLVLTGVTVPAKPGADQAGLIIPEVRVGWRPSRGLSVRLEQPSVTLIESGTGAYVPAELEQLGAISNAAGIVEWLRPLNRRATFYIRDGSLTVTDQESKPIRRMEHIQLSVLPVELPGRPAVHYRLKAGPMASPAGRFDCLAQEWLSMEGLGVVEISCEVDAGGAPGGRHYWKGTQP